MVSAPQCGHWCTPRGNKRRQFGFEHFCTPVAVFAGCNGLLSCSARMGSSVPRLLTEARWRNSLILLGRTAWPTPTKTASTTAPRTICQCITRNPRRAKNMVAQMGKVMITRKAMSIPPAIWSTTTLLRWCSDDSRHRVALVAVVATQG